MKMVKKLLALLMALTLCLPLAACDDDKPAGGEGKPSPSVSDQGPEAGGNAGEGDIGDTDPAAPSDFSTVSSYTEIPILADREPFDATPMSILRTSWWNYMGGFADGKELDEAQVQAILEQCDYQWQLRFDGDSALSMVRGSDAVEGSYEIKADNQTITMTLGGSNYAGVFTWPDQAIVVLVLVSEADPSTAMYFVMDEG